jgi:chromosomal replication initiator protein
MITLDLKSLWADIIRKLEPLIQRAMLITWFKDTVILGREEGKLIIGLPLPMFLNWHMEHYKDLILKAAKELDPAIEQIVYTVDISLREGDPRVFDVLALFPVPKRRKLPGRPEVRVAEGLTGKILNPRYTLDRFIVGSSNRLAHAASLAVAAQPGGKYNPLFIYGGVGLGKTHLLQGTGNELLHSQPQAVVLYTTSEEFTNQVIEAIKTQKMEQFRRRYRQVDMLIIDDVQFFASKERTQEEFFHTFNTLLESGKQLVISSDRPPKELHNVLDDRLCSRFERGMITDVQMPDFETRAAILTERAKEYEIFLDRTVVQFIAQHVTDSVRTLEGILMQAVAQYELEHRMPTVRSITEILQKLARDPHAKEDEVGFITPEQRAVRLEDVLEGVSRFYAVSLQDMLGHSRVREILLPRQIAMYIARKHLRVSLGQLGERFSGRDHSTVLHSIQKIDLLLNQDPHLLREIHTIEREMGVAPRPASSHTGADVTDRSPQPHVGQPCAADAGAAS